jgi:hypothetical protein
MNQVAGSITGTLRVGKNDDVEKATHTGLST